MRYERSVKMRIVLYLFEKKLLQFAKLLKKDTVIYICRDEEASEQPPVMPGALSVTIDGLPQLKFDYVIILTEEQKKSQKALAHLITKGIPSNKILEYYTFWKNPAKSRAEEFYENGAVPGYDGFIFGMSHSYGGLIEKILSGNYYKFSAPSMDLYYHYMVLKDVCSHYDMRLIKQVIFELPYYIFNYDISKCKNVFKQRMNYYYYYSDYHHFGANEEDRRQIEMFEALNSLCEKPYYAKSIGKTIKISKGRTACMFLKKQYLKGRYLFMRKEGHTWGKEEKEKIYELRPHVWYKQHEETQKENEGIWQEIKALLSNYSWIELKVAVFPFCPLFCDAHAPAIENMRRSFKDMLKIPEEQLVDCFDYYREKPEYFSDECHLNLLGQYKFSKSFNKLIG